MTEDEPLISEETEFEKKFRVTGLPREDLITWSKMRWEQPPFQYTPTGIKLTDSWTYMILLGGVDKIAFMIAEIFIDSDTDGTFNSKFAEKNFLLEDYSLRLIEQTLNFLINSGVVGALLLSILFPIALLPMLPSNESVAFFGDDQILVMLVFYAVFMYTSLFFSIWVTYMTLHYYLHITIWMPTLALKMWYVCELDTLPAVALVTHGCILASALALPFGIAVVITPAAGLIALVFDVIMLGVIAYSLFSPEGADSQLVRELHKQTQILLIDRGVLERHKVPDPFESKTSSCL
jgi:hypothetical protein